MAPQTSPGDASAREAATLTLSHTDRPASSSDAASSPVESSAAESTSEASSSSEEDSDASSSSGSESAAEEQPTVPLRSRLAAFIPQLAAANEQLVAVDADDGGGVKRKRGGFEIVESESEDQAEDGVRKQARGGAEDGDEEEEEEEGPYIEMSLGLGVLEETNAIEKDGILLPRGPIEDEDDDSESDTAAGASADGDDGGVMGILTAIKNSGAKRKNKSNERVKRIEEVPK